MRNHLCLRIVLLLLGILTSQLVDSFAPPAPVVRRAIIATTTTLAKAHQQSGDNNKEESVLLGSEEYYKGFVSRSLDQEPIERVTGDAILGPTFKFVGGFAVVLVALFAGFMASNGLL